MTGKHDEPAALAFVLEVGLQPGDGAAQAVAEAECEHGRPQSLQRLRKRGWLAAGRVKMADLLAACADKGQQGVVAWLVETLCGPSPSQHPLSPQLFASAATCGHVPLLQHLRARGCPWSKDAWRQVAWVGSEPLLEWLHAEGCPKPVSWVATFSRLRPHMLPPAHL
jgi:hypothetical protein